MNKNLLPPYLGAAYYPEDWDESEADYDLAMMKEAGIGCVRIAEFAWHKMEPRPGEFDFAWLHRAVDKISAAGLAIVMCTPTAAPPSWLARLHPEALREGENGRRTSHGGRRHFCSNNEDYCAYSLRIVTELAKEFGSEPNVIGWQIDNEIYSFGSGCFCPACQKRFAAHLRSRFGTIDALNAAWDSETWSQAYESFEGVPAPRDINHNPHLLMEWYDFQNESHVAFVRRQAEILRRFTKAPIGTDTMPLNGMNYRHLNETLDVVQFNHYNTPDNIWCAALWFDYLRTMRPHPFWNTETQTCWSGGAYAEQSIKPEGYCRINTWLPLALGGEANMYWLWRTHWAGHELMHGAVLDTSGRPMHIFGEVRRCAEEMEKAASFLNATRVKTQVALHFSSHNWNMMNAQCVVDGMSNKCLDRFYKPILDCGIRPDVIDAEAELSQYGVLISPLMMTLEEGDLPRRISSWVRGGGVWVVGPLTDIRNLDGARYKNRPFGMLEELTGAKWKYGIPDAEGRIKARWNEGTEFGGNMWYDVFEGDERALVRISEGHSALVGGACVLCCPVEKGHVIIVGSVPSHEDLMKIYRRAFELAAIPCEKTEGEVIVAPRVGGGREGVILIEYGNGTGSYRFDGSMTDILTGKRYSGGIELAPYDVAVLEKDR